MAPDRLVGLTWRLALKLSSGRLDHKKVNGRGHTVSKFLNRAAYSSKTLRRSSDSTGTLGNDAALKDRTGFSSGGGSGVDSSISISSCLEAIANSRGGTAQPSHEVSTKHAEVENTGGGPATTLEDWSWLDKVAPSKSSIELRPSLSLSGWLGYVQNEDSKNKSQTEKVEGPGPKVDAVANMNNILQLIHMSSDCTSLDGHLANFEGSLSMKQLTVILQIPANRRFAWSLYNWIKKQPNYCARIYIFLDVIDCLIAIGDWDALNSIMNDMSERKFHLDNHQFHRLLKACMRSRETFPQFVKLGHVLKWFRQQKDSGLKPDKLTFHTIMEMHNKAEMFKTTLSLFKEMQNHCVLLCGSYRYALSACRKLRSLEMAELIWKQMESSKLEPDLACYTILLAIYGDTGNVDKATAVFEEMQNRGCAPDLQAYTCLIWGYAKANRLVEATSAFQKLCSSGLNLDGAPYAAMMQMYSQAGYLENVLAIWYMAKEHGSRTSISSDSIAIQACIKKERWEDAMTVFKRMQYRGLTCGPKLCCDMLYVYYKAQHYHSCEQLFWAMMEDKFLEYPPKSYEIMIMMYESLGWELHALNILEIMKGRGCTPTANVYEMIILMALKTSLSHARDLYHEMQSAGYTPSYNLYATLIKYHMRTRDITSARLFYKEMRLTGFQPDREIFLSLFSDYEEAALDEEVLDIYRD